MNVVARGVLGAVFSAVLMTSGASAQAAKPFADVPDTHWAADAVTKLAQHGLLEGYPDGTYRGGRAVTRFEAALALQRLRTEFLRVTVSDLPRPGKQGLQGERGPAGAPGRPGEAGPMGPAGVAPEGWAELLAEQTKLREQFSATQSSFVTLRDELKALRGRLGEIQLNLEPVETRTSKVEKKAPRAPLGF